MQVASAPNPRQSLPAGRAGRRAGWEHIEEGLHGPRARKYRTVVCVLNHSSLVKELGERGAGRAVRQAWWWEALVKAEEPRKQEGCLELWQPASTLSSITRWEGLVSHRNSVEQSIFPFTTATSKRFESHNVEVRSPYICWCQRIASSDLCFRKLPRRREGRLGARGQLTGLL